jgi:hypothetical protein
MLSFKVNSTVIMTSGRPSLHREVTLYYEHKPGITKQKQNKGKLSLQRAVEAPTFSLDNRLTIAVKLSTLRAARPIPQEDFWYSFLLEAETNSRT